jgi:rare lipoprotein A
LEGDGPSQELDPGFFILKRGRLAMKRFILASFLILAVIGCIDAAYVRSFRQRGPATQGIKSPDLVGAHPSLPIGAKVTVTNLQNGSTAVVTITGRIAASGNRILDLSESAARALGMSAGDAAQITLEVIRDRSGAADDGSGEDFFEALETEG